MARRAATKGRLGERLSALEAACREVGARVTQQRREVLRAVVESDRHPDAQAVLHSVRERMPRISFDTVYRTLAFLQENGLIRRVQGTAERARFDGNDRPHHHFVCRKCGKIMDFESEDIDRMRLPVGVGKLGIAESRQLQIVGVCRACEKRKEESDG